jgi:hypothetical protein
MAYHFQNPIFVHVLSYIDNGRNNKWYSVMNDRAG